MGMGYAPASAIVTKKEEVGKLNLNSYELFNNYVNENNVTLMNVYLSVLYDDVLPECTKEDKQAILLYNDFTKEFKNTTGVRIELGYHDKEEDGCYYDEVNGFFFTLNEADLYQPTEEHKELKKKIEFQHESWVMFG